MKNPSVYIPRIFFEKNMTPQGCSYIFWTGTAKREESGGHRAEPWWGPGGGGGGGGRSILAIVYSSERF